MKKTSKSKIQDKLTLLIILTLAAGFFLLQPHNNTTNNKIKQTASNVINNKESKQIECNNPYGEIAKIIDENDIQRAPDICLYTGCGGFIY